MNEPRVVWFCPTCHFEVLAEEPWIPATEGEDLARTGQTHDTVWGNPVRFHDGHFRETIGAKPYRRDWSGAAGCWCSAPSHLTPRVLATRPERCSSVRARRL